MMKSRIIWIMSALCVVIVGVLLFAYSNSLRKIDVNRVERIQLGNGSTAPTLNAEETAKFIELFNSASYEGKTTGEGGTPDWTVFVYYRDGSYFSISEFGSAGSKCEVYVHNVNGGKKSDYYISSAELRAFVLEMLDQA